MPAATATTIPAMFLARVAESANRRAYSAWDGSRYKDFTWKDYHEQARAFGLGLKELGLERGDKVSILGATRAEWVIADVGALCVGGVTVGLYPTLQPEGIGSMHYVIDHSESKFLVVENLATLKAKIAPIFAKLPRVEKIILWDDADVKGAALPDPRIISWRDVLTMGRAANEKAPEAFAAECNAAKPEDLALLIYTSGTTGQPKGAMLTHGNVAQFQDAMDQVMPRSDNATGGTVSFLPMAHAAERCVAHYGRIRSGYATHFARSIETLLEDIATARPTRFGSVPRIFEKVYAKVTGEIAKTQGVKGKIAATIFKYGVEAGRHKAQGKKLLPHMRLAELAFQRTIASKLQARFGGRCGWFISGAAPIAVEILEFFDACGFKTYEVYGLTETVGILTANRPGGLKYGTVGRAIPGVELKIADDGEILAKGPNIFPGYYKEPAATAEALAGGWFHTGDIGTLDRDGFLKITDRKKNILVTAGGKNITPSNIENEVKNHPLISYCHLHADKRAFPSALVCLDPDQLKQFASDRGLRGTTAAELKNDPVVRAAVQEAIDKANAQFAQYERIKKFAILATEFSIDGGELTPSLKVKRKEVEKKYQAEIDGMYPAATSGGAASAEA